MASRLVAAATRLHLSPSAVSVTPRGLLAQLAFVLGAEVGPETLRAAIDEIAPREQGGFEVRRRAPHTSAIGG